MIRDFTYIDDIVEGVIRVIDRPAVSNADWSGDHPDSATSYARYRIFNIGNSRPVELMHYIQVLEDCLGKKAIMEMLPMQEGDVPSTVADVSELVAMSGFCPATSVETGIQRFVEWYRTYHAR